MPSGSHDGVPLLKAIAIVAVAGAIGAGCRTAGPPLPPSAAMRAGADAEIATRTTQVDPTTLDRKLMFGYQGWFGCPEDGSPLGSAYNPRTVDRHFRWMQEYDLAGVFLQRFTVGLGNPAVAGFRDAVARNVRSAAEAEVAAEVALTPEVESPS